MLLCDIGSIVLDMVSECIMTCLVLMLANGWFTRFQKIDYDDGMEVYGVMWVGVLILHIIFGTISFVDNDSYHKYHDFHGWVGYCLILSKLGLTGLYVWFYRDNLRQIPK